MVKVFRHDGYSPKTDIREFNDTPTMKVILSALALRDFMFAVRTYAMVSDHWALTKPEVNFLIAVATFTGFYLGHAPEPQGLPFLLLIQTLLGTLLVASGTGTLHQYIERRFDAQMRRTARRPLAAGRLNAPGVLWFRAALSAVGIIYLAIAVNVLASLLALVTLLSYVFLYTPLKRKTPLRTLVGPFTGAILR